MKERGYAAVEKISKKQCGEKTKMQTTEPCPRDQQKVHVGAVWRKKKAGLLRIDNGQKGGTRQK